MQRMTTVLLVEDSQADADLIQAILSDAMGSMPYSVLHVLRLADARSELTNGLCPDVILLDLTLPDSEGVSTVEHVAGAAPDTRIIVTTGQEDRVLAVACIAAGAQDYLHKDGLDAATLRRAVRFGVGAYRNRGMR